MWMALPLTDCCRELQADLCGFLVALCALGQEREAAERAAALEAQRRAEEAEAQRRKAEEVPDRAVQLIWSCLFVESLLLFPAVVLVLHSMLFVCSVGAES